MIERMFTRRNVLVLLACSIVAVGVVWTLRDREPSYNGRPLSKWLEEYGKLDPDDSVIEQANTALRHIGTNAFPYALKWMHKDGYSLFNPENQFRLTKMELKLDWFPKLQERIVESRVKAGVFADASIAPFSVLGPEAASAIPSLSNLLQNTTSTNTAMRAARALSLIGTNAFPVLLKTLSDTNTLPTVRREVAVNIGITPILATNARPAIPTLIKCLEDSDPRLPDIAALSLGRIAMEPELVVPALTNSLRHHTVLLKSRTLFALGAFGQNAKSALPTVLAALQDPDEGVRKGATNALKKIAPEILCSTHAQ